jgi:hypothetical protein
MNWKGFLYAQMRAFAALFLWVEFFGWPSKSWMELLWYCVFIILLEISYSKLRRILR